MAAAAARHHQLDISSLSVIGGPSGCYVPQMKKRMARWLQVIAASVAWRSRLRYKADRPEGLHDLKTSRLLKKPAT
jgi:hypothetical protein